MKLGTAPDSKGSHIYLSTDGDQYTYKCGHAGFPASRHYKAVEAVCAFLPLRQQLVWQLHCAQGCMMASVLCLAEHDTSGLLASYVSHTAYRDGDADFWDVHIDSSVCVQLLSSTAAASSNNSRCTSSSRK